jgi:hypothetical protein
MSVILSEAKDLTIGMRVHRNQLRSNEAKMIESNLKYCPPTRGLSLRSG